MRMWRIVTEYTDAPGARVIHVLDCPIFRTRTSASPYPPDMATVEAAYFYSAWNQGIAAVRRVASSAHKTRPTFPHLSLKVWACTAAETVCTHSFTLTRAGQELPHISPRQAPVAHRRVVHEPAP